MMLQKRKSRNRHKRHRNFISHKGAIRLLKDKFAADDNLKITDVTGAIAASKAKDTFALKSDASGVDITNFSADDKVDFANLGVKNKSDLTTTKDSQKQMADGNIYQVDMAENIAGKDYSNATHLENYLETENFQIHSKRQIINRFSKRQ